MSTSGTYVWSPSLGECVLYAFNQAGIRSSAILQEHMESARMAANLLQARWSALPIPLWTIDLQTVPLVAGTATYSVPAETITMLDAYVVQNTGGAAKDRLILPISRSEYASYPNPTQQGAVTVFWFDRLLSPTFTLWPVPDSTQPTLKYYRIRRIQDAVFTNGTGPEIPGFYMEAFVLGLAHRLAIIWAPEKAAGLKELADEAFEIASTQNTENSSIYVSPVVSGYWRP